MKKLTIKEATEQWVSEFNAFPESMIRKLMEYDFYEAHWIPLYKKRGLQLHDEK